MKATTRYIVYAIMALFCLVAGIGWGFGDIWPMILAFAVLFIGYELILKKV